MKKVILMSLFFAVLCSAQNFEVENLFNKIENASPNELIAIIEQGKSDSEKIDSYSLIILSLASLKSEDYINAELFLNQALLRSTVDKETYPPTETGGNSPLLALMALRQQIAFALSEASQKSVEDYQYLIDSLDNWQPKCDDQYSPGWDYEDSPNLKRCQSRFDELIGSNVDAMNQSKVLYTHPEYFTLLREWRDLSMASLFSDSDKMDTELENLQNKLLGIEAKLGIEGEVTKHQFLSSFDKTPSKIVGEWRLYKDDDYPGRVEFNELVNFNSNGRFCVKASTTFGGEYELTPTSLTLHYDVFGEIATQERKYDLIDNQLNLKNEKIGWVYYEKLSGNPSESCFKKLKSSD